jgi:hypothetical protein
MPPFSRHTTSAVLAGTSTCKAGRWGRHVGWVGSAAGGSQARLCGQAAAGWEGGAGGRTQSFAADVTGSEATRHTREPLSE